jgi:hypothetical protein
MGRKYRWMVRITLDHSFKRERKRVCVGKNGEGEERERRGKEAGEERK